MQPRAKKRPDVIVSINLSFESHRDIFFGISRRARTLHWRVHFVPFPEMFNSSNLSAINADGIITTHHGDNDCAKFLVQTKQPLVVIGPRETALDRRAAPTAYVRLDDYQIGLAAGQFLSRLGRFRSSAFICNNSHSSLARFREKGFSEVFRKIGIRTRVYNLPTLAAGCKEDIHALASFLADLPKPAAVMCIYDKRAVDVFEAIRVCPIKIPDEMAIISVDNESLICDLTEPPLTSIAPNYQELGERASYVLDRLMSKRKITTADYELKADTVIDRGSTRYIQPTARIIEEAKTFIERNATKGITASDVSDHLQISRRLMDLRFRQGTGKSVLSAIINKRIHAIKEKLRDTDLTIGRISLDCGFRSENHAKAIFKKLTGLSMRDWRKKARAQSAERSLTNSPTFHSHSHRTKQP